MGRNKHRKHRNLNGLHEEVVTPLPSQPGQLPLPTTPLNDMKVLTANYSVAELLSDTIQRLEFL